MVRAGDWLAGDSSAEKALVVWADSKLSTGQQPVPQQRSPSAPWAVWTGAQPAANQGKGLSTFTQHLLDCIWSNACSLEFHCAKQISINWSKVRRRTPAWSRLSYKETQREWGLFSLEKRRLWGDVTATSPYLLGSHQKERDRLVTEVHNRRTRVIGKYRRIQFDIRGKNSQNTGTGFPEGLGRLHSWRFSEPNWSMVRCWSRPCSGQEVGTEISSRLFQMSDFGILWNCLPDISSNGWRDGVAKAGSAHQHLRSCVWRRQESFFKMSKIMCANTSV